MKLTIILLTAACLTAAASGHGQRVTLNEKEAPLQKVFKEIRRQTGLNFLFSSEELRKASPVTITVKDVTVEEALQLCLNGQPFAYTVENNTIVVKQKPTVTLSEVEERQPPPVDIRGRITNDDNDPVIASITVKGTQQGTTSNADGYFELKAVDDNSSLLISSISIIPFEVKTSTILTLMASSGGIATLTAKIRVSSLNEVIINKGYYTEKQKYSVSNGGRVTAKDIEKQPVSNPLLALQGRVPGIVIEQSSGLPGSGIKVRVQGENSLRKGNDPLYIIDGVPYSSQLLPNLGTVLGNSGGGQNGNPFSFINPNDIEKIEVLKDADATAIYGSRAGNGAILITTKKGTSQQTKFDFAFDQGWGKVTRKLDLLNTRQYLDMRYEAIKNDGLTITSASNADLRLWDTTRYTDWQKILIGNTAHYTNFQGSVSGGSNNTNYLLGASYHKETTVFPGDFADQKGSIHLSVNSISANKKFKLGLLANYLIDDNNLSNTDLTVEAIRLAPDAPSLYNADGTLNWMPNASGSTTFVNPIRRIYNTYKSKTNNLVASFNFGYQILPSLEFRTNAGFTKMQTKDYLSNPWIANLPEDRSANSRSGNYGYNDLNSWIVEPQLSFEKEFSESKFNAFIGTTFHENKGSANQFSGTGFNSDEAIKDIRSAATVRATSSTEFTYKYNALFGRVNYILKDRYVANATLRRDGSSRFGSKNQFHNFWSVGGAWIFSEEGLIQKNLPFLSFGKLRFSYGTTGNDQIGDYSFLNLYTAVSPAYQNVTGLTTTGLPNPYLQWEETKKLQAGIDLGLFKDDISLNITYYRNRSSNQLLADPLPIVTGFTSIPNNLPATLQNSGWEFGLNSKILDAKNLKWTNFLNVTIPRNRLVKFPNLAGSAYANSYFLNEPTTFFNAYKFIGVDPATGIYQFSDGKGGTTNRPDTSLSARFVHINSSPSLYGGLQNSVEYRNFTIDFLFQFVIQKAQNYRFGFLPGERNGGLGNQPIWVLDRWQKPGDVAPIQKYNSNFSLSDNYTAATSSDAAYSDASYVRLKNLSISWRAPDKLVKKILLRTAAIYVQGQNLITFSDYKGLDPETKSSFTLPPLRMITIGIKVGF